MKISLTAGIEVILNLVVKRRTKGEIVRLPGIGGGYTLPHSVGSEYLNL